MGEGGGGVKGLEGGSTQVMVRCDKDEGRAEMNCKKLLSDVFPSINSALGDVVWGESYLCSESHACFLSTHTKRVDSSGGRFVTSLCFETCVSQH